MTQNEPQTDQCPESMKRILYDTVSHRMADGQERSFRRGSIVWNVWNDWIGQADWLQLYYRMDCSLSLCQSHPGHSDSSGMQPIVPNAVGQSGHDDWTAIRCASPMKSLGISLAFTMHPFWCTWLPVYQKSPMISFQLNLTRWIGLIANPRSGEGPEIRNCGNRHQMEK